MRAETRNPMTEMNQNQNLEKVSYEDLKNLVVARRSIYDFKPGVPDRKLLERSIDAARWAPNHKHTRPWRFYLLGEKSADVIVSRYHELVREKRGEETARIKSVRWEAVPAWLVVTSRRSEDSVQDREDYGSCCCTIQNLALLLWSEGVGLKWTTGPVTRDPAFLAITGIDLEKENVVGLFGYGYAEVIPAAKRPPVSESLVIVD